MKTSILDRGFTILLLLLGLFVTARAWHYGFYRDGVPGPGFFPAIAGIMLAVLAAAVLLRDLAGRARIEGRVEPGVIAAIGGATAAMLAFVWLAPVVGMAVAGAALMIVIGLLAEEDGKRGRKFYQRLVLASVGTVIACHILFTQVIGVPLVEGPLGF